MNAIGILKTAAELVVSVGVGAVVGNAIKISTPVDAKILQKVSIGIGAFVLSNMVGDYAAKYTTKNIEDGIAEFKKAKDAVTVVIQEQEQ